jgi:hypothetical protein
VNAKNTVKTVKGIKIACILILNFENNEFKLKTIAPFFFNHSNGCDREFPFQTDKLKHA